MGERQATLKEIIHRNFPVFKHPKPSLENYKSSEHWQTIETIYLSLSGKATQPPIRFGSWDISTKHFIIELDEERHFNRYRAQTLTSLIYSDEHNFSVAEYLKYCELYERHCLRAARWGRNWKNSSTEKQFGISNIEGDLNSSGSSRWKQRAYNDFLRDIASRIINVPVFRISIYDTFENNTVQNLLVNGNESQLLNLVTEKTMRAKKMI